MENCRGINYADLFTGRMMAVADKDDDGNSKWFAASDTYYLDAKDQTQDFTRQKCATLQ